MFSESLHYLNKSSVPYKICKIHHLAQLSFFFNFQLTFYSDLNYMLKLYFVIVAQLCPTLCDPMDCSPSDFSLHGDFPGKNALLHKLYFTTFKIGNPMFSLPCILWHMTVFLPVWDLLASYLLCCFLTATTKFLFLFFFLIDGLHFFFGDTAWQNSEMGPNGLQSCCWQGCTALESYSTECPCLLETSRACLQVLSLLLFLSPSQYGWYSVVHIISFWHWGSCLHLLLTRAFVIT